VGDDDELGALGEGTQFFDEPPDVASSSAASTSSRTQIGEGFA